MRRPYILIVEDETIVAKDIEFTLEGMGYGVAGIADSGEDAVELAEKTRPDLILMDVKLRGRMDGIEAAKRISACHSMPIILLSAFPDRLRTDGDAGNVRAYMIKPFNERILESTIKTVLRKSAHKMG